MLIYILIHEVLHALLLEREIKSLCPSQEGDEVISGILYCLLSFTPDIVIGVNNIVEKL